MLLFFFSLCLLASVICLDRPREGDRGSKVRKMSPLFAKVKNRRSQREELKKLLSALLCNV